MYLNGKKAMHGDTMVEVLLSIAIVGAVITGAYALASHSLQESISASEHTQATKLAEGQIEALKFRQKNTTSNVDSDPNSWGNKFATANNFCLKTDVLTASSPGWFPTQNGSGSFNPETLGVAASRYNAQCVNSSKYFINVTTPAGADANNRTFLVIVRWEAPGGGPQSKTQLYYRF